MELIFICTIFFLIGIAVSCFATVVGRWMQRYKEITEDTKTKLEKLESDLSGRRVRNPHLTNSGIEDALAIFRDIEETRIYEDARINRLVQILRQIRSDPGRYNEDEPNGKKPVWRKEE